MLFRHFYIVHTLTTYVMSDGFEYFKAKSTILKRFFYKGTFRRGLLVFQTPSSSKSWQTQMQYKDRERHLFLFIMKFLK